MTGRYLKTKILQVDAISSPVNQSNVQGLSGAYRRAGELHTFDYRAASSQVGRPAMNAALIQFAAQVQPDLIHLEKCELVTSDTIRQIRGQTSSMIAHVFPDYRGRIPPYVAAACPHVDWALRPHEDPGWAEQCQAAGGEQVGFWCRGTDPEVFKPYPVEKRYDLVMMSNLAGTPIPDAGQGERGGFLLDLDRAGLQIHLFGAGNEDFAARHDGIVWHDHVDLGQFAEAVSAAKIALSFNAGHIQMYCSWRRLFNTMAAGCFIAVNYFPGLESVFENGRHLAWFKTSGEAEELIRYYLAHDGEREVIAYQGRQEVIAHHTWDIRVAEMLKRCN